MFRPRRLLGFLSGYMSAHFFLHPWKGVGGTRALAHSIMHKTIWWWKMVMLTVMNVGQMSYIHNLMFFFHRRFASGLVPGRQPESRGIVFSHAEDFRHTHFFTHRSFLHTQKFSYTHFLHTFFRNLLRNPVEPDLALHPSLQDLLRNLLRNLVEPDPAPATVHTGAILGWRPH